MEYFTVNMIKKKKCISALNIALLAVLDKRVLNLFRTVQKNKKTMCRSEEDDMVSFYLFLNRF